jgi:hypothetical protein
MINDERRFNALNVNELCVTVFFLNFFFVSVQAFINGFNRQRFVGKFKFDRKAVIEREPDDFAAFAEARRALADSKLNSLCRASSRAEIVNADANAAFKPSIVLCLTLMFRRAVENPACFARIRLDVFHRRCLNSVRSGRVNNTSTKIERK